MNRLLSLLMLLIVVAASSCTREFVCQCEVTYTGSDPGLPGKSYNSYIVKDTKANAAKKCEANSTTVTTGNVTLSESCKLY
jgi:hypothetical protein